MEPYPNISIVQLSTTVGLPSTVWEVELVTFFPGLTASMCAHGHMHMCLKRDWTGYSDKLL